MRSSISDFLEARIDGHLTKIGVFQKAVVSDGVISGQRFLLSFRPVPSLGVFDAKSWLKKQFLVYTHATVCNNCSSSTSYCCLFLDCGEVSDLNGEFTIMRDVIFEIGKVRQ